MDGLSLDDTEELVLAFEDRGRRMIARRRVCQWLGCALLMSCVPVGPDPGSVRDGPAVDDPGWVEVALPDALETIGGHAIVSVPEALLEVLVVRRDADTVVAVWRICSHGACPLSWAADVGVLVCPCHGSEFDTAGLVLKGPATDDVRAFPAEIRGDLLRIYRPL